MKTAGQKKVVALFVVEFLMEIGGMENAMLLVSGRKMCFLFLSSRTHWHTVRCCIQLCSKKDSIAGYPV